VSLNYLGSIESNLMSQRSL
jgi:hypothetical protein